MKIAMTALAIVLLAGATTAAAQPGERGQRERDDRSQGRGQRSEQADRPQRSESADRPQREWSGDRPQRDGGGERPARNVIRDAPRPAQPAQAVQAPQAPQAQAPRGEGRSGDRQVWTGRRGGGDSLGERGRNRDDGARSDGDRRRDGDGQNWNGRRDNDRRDWDRRDGDGRWNGRSDNDRRDWSRGGDNHQNDRWSDRRFDSYPRWERGRYASSYPSSHRYRHVWRRPSGFYVNFWNYGDFLPRGWYGSGYWLDSPWQFSLPLPPPGYDWVRVGDDALLVDEYTGRVVQVVRNVFW